MKRHAASAKHALNVGTVKTNATLNCIFTPCISSFDKQVQKSEIVLSWFFTEHDISFRIVDELVATIKSIFPDSKIATDVRLGRTE